MDISIQQLVFYMFAVGLIMSALAVVTVRNTVHAALFLVVAFFSSAALWLMLEAEFLAVVLVLVYVGAVMVLFLFVIMMLDINVSRLREGFSAFLPLGALVALLMMGLLIYIVGGDSFGLEKYAEPVRHAADYNNTAELGAVLYTVYMYPFEIASLVLLVAIIAAITLTQRRRQDSRKQDPSRQVLVKKADRLKIIKMEAEKN
ncbi:MAG: NADH-quinone oxidoreductase subunit J [Gammaproteobacteria bacterium]|nr:MAG: NADH-quinone oxidoreductase subunit J [Gammaproteobacteria bacterium]